MANAHRLDVVLALDRGSSASEGLTRQLYAQLRAAILSGQLKAGERLPPTRALARTLGVARLTVATAYDWLRAEGYVYGRVGAGTYVATALGDVQSVSGVRPGTGSARLEQSAVYTGVSANTPVASSTARPPLTQWARRLATMPIIGIGVQDHIEFDFRPGIGAAELFPWVRWRRVVGWQDPFDPRAEQQAQQRASAVLSGRWDALLGPPETRQAIAAWLRRSRSVRCEPEQVLVAASVQQMLALLARLLVEPGQSLIVEDPGYIGFHAAFYAEGARLRGVAVDESGLRVDALPEPGSDSPERAAHLAVVTPSHQYPTGVTLSLERRLALLDWARRSEVVLVEDDYDGELRLEGQPLEALRALDDRDEVIYLGTFAKSLYPATRLGYAILPQWLVEPVARARAASDRHPVWRDAIAVARFIEAGELDRHLARMRRHYKARRDALVRAVRAELGGLLALGPADAGIHLLARLPDGVDDVQMGAQAAACGIALTPLSPHYAGASHPGLLLGFGALDEERLALGVRALTPIVDAACRGVQ